MSTHKTTPAPGATGHEGHASKNLHGTEQPQVYHRIAYINAGDHVMMCGHRRPVGPTFKKRELPPNAVTCALCSAAQFLINEVDW